MAPNVASSPNENWETQIRKGWLDLVILASLWKEKLYGLDIIRRLEAHSELLVSEGTIYPILGRLKRDGFVDAEWVESDAGHPRKYYWLTPSGRRRAAAMARHASTFLARIDSLIEPILAKEER